MYQINPKLLSNASFVLPATSSLMKNKVIKGNFQLALCHKSSPNFKFSVLLIRYWMNTSFNFQWKNFSIRKSRLNWATKKKVPSPGKLLIWSFKTSFLRSNRPSMKISLLDNFQQKEIYFCRTTQFDVLFV